MVAGCGKCGSFIDSKFEAIPLIGKPFPLQAPFSIFPFIGQPLLSRLRCRMKNYSATVMVVEDDPVDQMLISRALKRGWAQGSIHIFGGAQEAIACLLGEGIFSDRIKHPFPSFIITDTKMVNGDGFYLLEFLKGRPEFSVIPTIVLSASRNPSDVERAYQLGANAYHIKPLEAVDFERMVIGIHAYWVNCEVPDVNHVGRRFVASDEESIEDRFCKPPA